MRSSLTHKMDLLSGLLLVLTLATAIVNAEIPDMVAHVSRAACPDGFYDTVLRRCIFVVLSPPANMTFDDARARCGSLNGRLLHIESRQEEQHVFNLISGDGKNRSAYLDLYYHEGNNRWRWSSGFPGSYLNHRLSFNPRPGHRIAMVDMNEGAWVQVRSNATLPVRPALVCENDTCPPDFYLDNILRKCIHVHHFDYKDHMNFSTAMRLCSNKGARLLRINNAVEQSRVADHRSASMVTEDLVGSRPRSKTLFLDMEKVGGVFQWRTAPKTVTYSNWYSGQFAQYYSNVRVYQARWSSVNDDDQDSPVLACQRAVTATQCTHFKKPFCPKSAQCATIDGKQVCYGKWNTSLDGPTPGIYDWYFGLHQCTSNVELSWTNGAACNCSYELVVRNKTTGAVLHRNTSIPFSVTKLTFEKWRSLTQYVFEVRLVWKPEGRVVDTKRTSIVVPTPPAPQVKVIQKKTPVLEVTTVLPPSTKGVKETCCRLTLKRRYTPIAWGKPAAAQMKHRVARRSTEDDPTADGNFTSTGNTTLDSNSTAAGNSTGDYMSSDLDNATMEGNSTFDGDSTSVENTIDGGNETTDSNSTSAGNFTAVNQTTVEANSAVEGNSTPAGNSTFAGNTTADSNFTLDGSSTVMANSTNETTDSISTFDGNFTAVNQTTVEANSAVEGNSTSAGNSTFAGNTTADSNFTLDGGSAVMANSTDDGNSTVSDDSSDFLPLGKRPWWEACIDTQSTVVPFWGVVPESLYEVYCYASNTLNKDGPHSATVDVDTRECTVTAPRHGTVTPDVDSIQSQSSVTYTCLPGYKLSGMASATCIYKPEADMLMLNASTPDCLDVDECAASSHNCDGNASCANTDGSFTCACNTGYSGDGLTCKPRQCHVWTPKNGQVRGGVSTTAYNTTVSYSCYNDFHLLVGQSTARCEAVSPTIMSLATPTPFCEPPLHYQCANFDIFRPRKDSTRMTFANAKQACLRANSTLPPWAARGCVKAAVTAGFASTTPAWIDHYDTDTTVFVVYKNPAGQGALSSVDTNKGSAYVPLCAQPRIMTV